MTPSPPERSWKRSAATVTATGVALVGLPILAVTSALTGPATSAPSPDECTYDARFTDPEGDVNDLVVVPVDPALDPDGLDLREAWLSTNETGDAVTFHIKVTDLSVFSGGLRGISDLFHWSFSLAGKKYVVEARRDLLVLQSPLSAPGVFELTGEGITTPRSLTGSFDPDFDLVTVTVKANDFPSLGATPDLKAGAVLGGFKIISSRGLAPIEEEVDRAKTTCTYTVGAVKPTEK